MKKYALLMICAFLSIHTYSQIGNVAYKSTDDESYSKVTVNTITDISGFDKDENCKHISRFLCDEKIYNFPADIKQEEIRIDFKGEKVHGFINGKDMECLTNEQFVFLYLKRVDNLTLEEIHELGYLPEDLIPKMEEEKAVLNEMGKNKSQVGINFLGASLRSEPKIDSEVISNIPPNDTVTIFNGTYMKPFIKAQYGEEVGYISISFINDTEIVSAIEAKEKELETYINAMLAN